jgi:hypothetical protein
MTSHDALHDRWQDRYHIYGSMIVIEPKFSFHFKNNSFSMISLLSFRYKHRLRNFILILSLIIHLPIGILLLYYLIQKNYTSETNQFISSPSIIGQRSNYAIQNTFNISSNVQIVNLNASAKTTLHCIKTKILLDHISTNICIHETKNDMFVSGTFYKSDFIWEEAEVTRIL